ncbi:hypothetical protein DSAG12_03014 [Promethearchaeum syntrophicum]|uniref:Uncharacterized protein n=1 Tax=Promethearchaeum syntrophicum TaxID=2594042 RepID=A0A5B9DDI7_9ARCH|nr:hypothetical protein [Candidatus Prometheoarchaeum syntrophicum]QEE17182.1 hypothetical protein DSAG12_03014 [Candidatus Prometheoarchaeum syntrophicum]
MNEPFVIESVCNHLKKNTTHFWIDTHPTLKHLSFNKFRLNIDGHAPDIFGVDKYNRVFAIEAKGIDNIEKAIGQALIYKKGVMYSYIAAARFKLKRYRDLIESIGLGLFLVDESGNIEQIEPRFSYAPIFLNDVSNTIELLLAEKKPSIRLVKLGKTQVLNYISPIFYTSLSNPIEKSSLQTIITRDWGVDLFKDSHVINGCLYLGLLQEANNNFSLTPLGEGFCKSLLKMGYNNKILIKIKKSLKGNKKLYDEEPELAYMIRTLYERKIEYQQFLKILYSFNRTEISMDEILEVVIKSYPTMYINIFCNKKMDFEEIRKYYQEGDYEKLKSREILEKNLNRNIYFAFKIQLLHLGILCSIKFSDNRSSSSFSGKFEDYDPKCDIWVINGDLK